MNNTELMAVLRELPPLLPQFLQRRRVGLSTPGDLSAELGIERWLVFVLVQISFTQGIQGKDVVTLAEIRAYDPYFSIDRYSEPVAQLVERGLVLRDTNGALTLSQQARAAVDRMHTEGTAFVARKTPVAQEDLEGLAN